TYVFTKAMAEMIIWKHKKDLPVVVIRPTMICSTLKDPFPGWIEGSGSAASGSIVFGKGLIHLTHGDRECAFDLIPADTVTNCIITAMMANA
ncbi:SDR family oxidoreductase, partial [Halorubellus sp. PRR65]|uniref:SDR family oxidoreductase n=1 Tax=Halorubellus sp. PRR65 TaxID=3098148 RepID=UPI002B256AB3